MYRKQQHFIEAWLNKENRKPLVVRGARQVGKSTLVRQTVASAGRSLVEVNCELYPQLEIVFKTLDVRKIIDEIESLPGKRRIEPNTVLFLDEVQATPTALAALRYFFEERPEIPVICAGSLLEFVLADLDFSMPVGRIEFLNVVPMDFEEFLQALDEQKLFDVLQTFTVKQPMSEGQHQRLLELLQKYCFVGGMPEAVREYAKEKKLSVARDVHESILESYKSDFSKYGLKQDLLRLNQLLDRVAQQVTKRVKYNQLLSNEQSRTVKRLLDLLIHARLVSKVTHSDSSDIPLGAEARSDVYKLLLLDVGLLNAILGLPWEVIRREDSILSVRDGSVSEQFVGQELIATLERGTQRLHYWLRDGKSTNAEVDYVVVNKGTIFPVEVKAGKSGSLKSLRVFSDLKKPKIAVRFDANMPSLQEMKDSSDEPKSYQLLSLPLYAVSQLERLTHE